MKWVEEKTWRNYPVEVSSFISPRETFVDFSARGLKYVNEQIIPYLKSVKTVATNECIYEYHSSLELISNKKLLVIGAGPSSERISISDINKYDMVFSCNHFFANDLFDHIDCDIVFLGDEVNLLNPRLITYLNNHINTKICFENIGRPKYDLVHFKRQYKDRVIWSNTRYHSKIGAIPRMVAYLCVFNPYSIDIVGMDGYIPQNLQQQYNHFFQKNKKPTGTLEQSNIEHKILEKYANQYLEFWDYILHDIGKDISFTNLGHNHPCNITTTVLEQQLGINYTDYLKNKDLRL